MAPHPRTCHNFLLAISNLLPFPVCVSLPLSSDGGPGGALIPCPKPGGYRGLLSGAKAPGIPSRLAAPGNCKRGAHGGLGAKCAAAAAYSCKGGGSTPDSSTISLKGFTVRALFSQSLKSLKSNGSISAPTARGRRRSLGFLLWRDRKSICLFITEYSSSCHCRFLQFFTQHRGFMRRGCHSPRISPTVIICFITLVHTVFFQMGVFRCCYGPCALFLCCGRCVSVSCACWKFTNHNIV